jgi:hypothetical protein
MSAAWGSAVLAMGIALGLLGCGGNDPEMSTCSNNIPRGFADPPDDVTVAVGGVARFSAVYQREADPNGGGGTVVLEWYRGSGVTPIETGTLVLSETKARADEVRRGADGEACALEYNAVHTAPPAVEADDGVRYQLRVRDLNSPQFGGGEVVRDSNVFLLTVDTLTPRNLRATPGVDSVTLSWDRDPAALRYELERSTGVGDFTPAATFNGPADMRLDQGLTALTGYRYRLRAVDAIRTSMPAEIAVTTLPSMQPDGWVEYPGGPLSASSGGDQTPSLVVQRDGTPIVAYVETIAGLGRLFVKRFDGTAWRTLGGAALNAGGQTGASKPSLVVDREDRPSVAWSQGNGQEQNIFVARFNGSAGWQSLGAPGLQVNNANGAIAIEPSLALSNRDQPVVAWVENGQVRVKFFASDEDPARWRDFSGGPGPTSNNAIDVELFMESGVQPHVAWLESFSGERALRVARGVDWQALGAAVGPLNSQTLLLRNDFGLIVEPGSTLTNGAAVVGYGQGLIPWSIPQRRWGGASWLNSFSPTDEAGNVELQGLSFGRSASNRAVVYTTRVDNVQSALQVRRLAPGGWQAAGPQLTLASTPTLALALAAPVSPVVATVERSGSTYTLRVRRFFP